MLLEAALARVVCPLVTGDSKKRLSPDVNQIEQRAKEFEDASARKGSLDGLNMNDLLILSNQNAHFQDTLWAF